MIKYSLDRINRGFQFSCLVAEQCSPGEVWGLQDPPGAQKNIIFILVKMHLVKQLLKNLVIGRKLVNIYINPCSNIQYS